MSAKTTKQLSTHAVIRENALILYLDKSETPVVARFDLDSLAQANFIIQPEGNLHRLNMRDFSNNTQTIAEFSNKIDAHQALNHILQALVNHKLPKEMVTSPKVAIIFGWALKVLGIAFIALCLYLAYNYIRMHQRTPASSIEQSAASTTDGEAQDLEELLTSPPTAER